MSQSPGKSADEANVSEVQRYRSAWSALSQLIGEGRSFSGKERNCFFLNTGADRFTECAGAFGLDLADDGRAVALTDWNFDGNLDLWLTNRTAPRVKLLLNPRPATKQWLMLKLTGTNSNRDAVGARVELYLKGQSQPRVRSLRAGEGFLAQSSKWIHFGLPAEDKVDHVEVQWPGERRERFDKLTRGEHWELVEGTGQARRWSVPSNFSTMPPQQAGKTLRATTVHSGNTRTWLLGRVPLIEPNYQTNDGLRSTDQFVGSPVLVNLWSKTCQTCWRELRDWTDHRRSLEQAGLRVVALSVDALTAKSNSAPTSLDKIDWPFEVGEATTEFVEGLEILQRSFIELQQPLPVPSSFLLDRDGLLVAIYKGETSAERLIEDVGFLDKKPHEQRLAAVPLSGRWASEPFESNPGAVVGALAMADRDAEGVAYLSRYVDRVPKENPSRNKALEELGRRQLQADQKQAAIETFDRLQQTSKDYSQLRGVAILLLEHGHPRASVSHFEKALTLATTSRPPRPLDSRVLSGASLAHISTGNSERAVHLLKEAIKLEPQNAQHRYHLGNALVMAQKPDEATDAFKSAVSLKPTWALAANNLAWLLSASADPAIRDGELALKVLNDANINETSTAPSVLSTLAVAYAEAANYDAAIRCNAKAIMLIREKKGGTLAKETDMLRRLQLRQQRFKAGKPWRDD